MNPLITQLFDQLKSLESSRQQHDAVLKMMLLLERATGRPEADEELCRTFLPEELLFLHLSLSEIEEIFDELVDSLNSDHLLLSTKTSLYGVIAKLADLKHADDILRFVADHVDTFNQDDLSCINNLSYFIMRAQDMPQIRELLAKHKILGLTERFRTHSSPYVRESVGYLIKDLQRLA